MKELLTYIARNLVDAPDAVAVTEHPGESETVLELRVAPEDMGKVIGRQGRIAKESPTLWGWGARGRVTGFSLQMVSLTRGRAELGGPPLLLLEISEERCRKYNSCCSPYHRG